MIAPSRAAVPLQHAVQRLAERGAFVDLVRALADLGAHPIDRLGGQRRDARQHLQAGHGGNAIGSALAAATRLIEGNDIRGERKVIDLSGDSANSWSGIPIPVARAEALAHGIVINGLPIMVKEPSYSTMDIDNLDWYYEDCVIGGPGSFVVPIKGRDKFKEAIRSKLLQEVAGRTRTRPVVAVADKEPRVSCLIGEKIWQDRWGR